MVQGWKRKGTLLWSAACGLLLAGGGQAAADDLSADIRALIEAQRQQLEQQNKILEAQSQRLEEQGRQLEALKKQVDGGAETPVTLEEAAGAAPKAAGAPVGEAAVKKIIGEYLRDNPGAGMPPSVQTGYELGKGFAIRSAPNPAYPKWQDESRIPFELRIRGRLQAAYVGFKSTDVLNHQTGQLAFNANTAREADYSQIEAKRINLIAEGTAFSPDLRYRVNFNGFSRGIGGFQNNEVVATAGVVAPNTLATSPIGGGVLVSHGVTLFEAFIAYDWRPCCAAKGCAPDCPEGEVKYSPTFTAIVGKFKPFFGLEEFLGNATMQFVEFSMADLYFDADDDTRMMAAGLEVKALEDRLFAQAIVTNGSEAFTPNLQLDKTPGFIVGAWYDFGGQWNAQRKAWDLYGGSVSDNAYSCKPVMRVGGSVNLVPMDRRSLYGDAETARYFTMPGGLGGTRVINMLSGGFNGTPPAATTPAGTHAVDRFDAYSFNTFVGAKYKGFSFFNEWWLRQLTNFETTVNGNNTIIYRSTLPGGNALFPINRDLVDYGMNVSVGCFLVPKKLEIAARWAWIRGRSGDINGNGTASTVVIPGVGATNVINGAFTNWAEANEYTVGLNYYFKGHALKWQTDFSIYDGGNPAAGGQSISGFIAGADGYMLRSQIQLFF